MPGAKPEEKEDGSGRFSTIAELANELGVPQHILRYWETRFPQLRPLQRSGNRRYYRPDDAALARYIHRLLNHEGYTVRGVQQLLAPKTSEAFHEPMPPESEVRRSAVADEARPYRRSDLPNAADPGGFATANAVVELLGGERCFHVVPQVALDVHDLLAVGLPGRALTALVEAVRTLRKPELLERALGISVRTYQRRQDSPDVTLSPEQSARLWKFAEILAQATELLGSQEEAEDWLDRPAVGLDQRRPIDLLATPAGVHLIEQHLGRLRFGVYA